MSEMLSFHFDVDGESFASAGQASVQVKKDLRSRIVAMSFCEPRSWHNNLSS